MQSIGFLSLTLKKVMVLQSNSVILISVGYLYISIKRTEISQKKHKKNEKNIKI
jgi:hypothetical protein